jgi:RNA-directed DNA polymerase
MGPDVFRTQSRVPTETLGTSGRCQRISLEQMTKELAAYLQGWKGYFGFCQTPSLLKALDEWIRRRLRSKIWKQWKHGKQRYAKLRQLGVGKDLAAQTAGKSMRSVESGEESRPVLRASHRLL